MTPLLAVIAAVVTSTNTGTCFTPTEQTAGWKRVDLPDEAPGLAAPAEIDQFRSGEGAWVVEQDPHGYTGATDQSRGRMDYTFRVAPETRRLHLRFVETLRGSKVDITVYGAGGRTFPLWDEQRISTNTIDVEWNLVDIDHVVVRVHHHLRPVPVVAEWRTARWVQLADDTSVPAVFRVSRSLYFRHPGGRTIQLCDRPGQVLTVVRGQLAGSPSSVSLRRQAQ